MAAEKFKLGIIGGSGMLGRAIAMGLLESGAVAPDGLWISNRSGRLDAMAGYEGITVTDSNRALAEACDVILLSVPPANAGDIGISARDRLVISVMAGVPIDRIAALTGAARVVRAMSSPAAELCLAFSPWVAAPGLRAEDRALVSGVLGAVGAEAEVDSESQIDCFTALTGPVPGFVALFASCMVDYAIENGVKPEVADMAVRQLFLASGRMMADGAATPEDHVRAMTDYAGTTAAGLLAMKAGSLRRTIFDGLDAAIAKTRTISSPDRRS